MHSPPHIAAAVPVESVLRGEPGYPAALALMRAEDGRAHDGLGRDFPPPRLWLRGRVPTGRAVAVVGARAASAASLKLARSLAEALARNGVTVVSGGALGVDGAAHRGALDGAQESTGGTVVVLGSGLDVPYPPRHAPLFDEVVARGGAVLSQFPPGTAPSKWTFPVRNRIIAALAELTLVVEAGAGSGALYTSRAARLLGRPVLAVPGSAGCERLLAEGAGVVRDVDELLAVVFEGRDPASHQVAVAPAPTPPPDDPHAIKLYEALDGTPRDLSELAARAGLPAAEVMSLAIELELGGHAVRVAGGRYQRSG